MEGIGLGDPPLASGRWGQGWGTARPPGFTFGYNSGITQNHPMADSSSRFGFVAFAETWNGRLAMLGFVIGLATELLTGQGILSQIGLG